MQKDNFSTAYSKEWTENAYEILVDRIKLPNKEAIWIKSLQ